MRLRIFNYDYYNIIDNPYDRQLECPVLVICGREENGKLHIVKVPGNKGIFRPHFYVENKESNIQIIEQLELEYEEWPYPAVYDKNEKVLVVYTKFPYEVRQIRGYFEHTYEADVRYPYMFIMKLGLEGGYLECPDKEWIETEDIKPISEDEHFYVKPRIFYVDIETEFIDPDQGFDLDNQKIISLVVYDNYDEVYHTIEYDPSYKGYWSESRVAERRFNADHTPRELLEITYHCQDEQTLLKIFFRLFRERPDAIFTFNGHGGNELVSKSSKTVREWHNGFDEPVIYKRALKLGLREDIQFISPLPGVKDKFGKYSGVYKRGYDEKFEVVIRGLTPLDFYYAEPLMKYTEKYRDFFGRSLEAYLQYFAHSGKIKHEGLTVAELKKQDLEKELYYNRIDVEGMVFLDNKFGFSDDIFDTVSLSMVQGIDVLQATKIHDFIVLNESQKECVYDTKHQDWKRDKWVGWIKERVGGYNIPIKRGIYGWTAVLDFSGLYPNIASAVNAGIDTKINVVKEDDEAYYDDKGKRWAKKDVFITPPAPFRKDKISINKKIWDKLLAHRAKYKTKLAEVYEEVNHDISHPLYKLYWAKHYNLKTRLINNKYGASGNPGFRNFDLAVYNSMPSIAQEILKYLERDVLPSLGTFARGGDTDSIFVALHSDNLEDAVYEAKAYAENINKFLSKFMKEEFNVDKHNIIMGAEAIGPKFYGHKKKNYLMEIWWLDGKELSEENRYIMYKGFEMKKRNRADITELIQKVFFKIVLKSESTEEIIEKMAGVIKRSDELFQYLPLRKICQRINIRKRLNDYDDSYMSKRAAIFANRNLGTNFGLGSSGYMGWLRMNGNTRLQPVVMFTENELKKVKKRFQLDYEAHKQKFVVEKFNNILEVYHTDYHKLLRGTRITSVFAL